MPATQPITEESLRAKFTELLPHLNERQRRLTLGAEARHLGEGSIRMIARAAGVHPDTVRKGVRELAGQLEPTAVIRGPGGGRRKAEEGDPDLGTALEKLVDPATRGEPTSPLRWTTKSTRELAKALTTAGHKASHFLVARLLKEAGYSLQGNRKTREGKGHPDRDAQFAYLNAAAEEHLAAGQPVISVDTKKKELIGENNGREWQPKGQPTPVKVHDFPDKTLGKAVPYGIYDLAANTGWGSTGTPPPSQCSPSAAGGTPQAPSSTRTPTGC